MGFFKFTNSLLHGILLPRRNIYSLLCAKIKLSIDRPLPIGPRDLASFYRSCLMAFPPLAWADQALPMLDGVFRELLEGIRGKTLLCFVFNLVISLDVAVILPLHLVGIAELSSLRLVGAD